MMSLDKKNKEGMVIPVADIVLLPGMAYTLKLNKISEEELQNLEDKQQFSIALPLKQNFNQNQLKEEDFHRVGVTFHVNDVEKTEKGYQVKIKTLDRVEINELTIESGFIRVEFEVTPDIIDLNEKGQEEMIECIKKVTREVSERFKGSDQFMKMIEDQKDLNSLMAHLTQFMPLTNEEKYDLIKIKSLKERSLKFMDYILKQKEALKLQLEMAEKFTQKANKGYREAVLRDQLKAIQTELDEGKSEGAKKDKTYIDKIEEAQMPDEIKTVALDELEKLERQSENSAEYNVVRNYLDLLVKLPWKKSEQKIINLGEARRILDQQHYGLDKVKDRIIQHLAVMQLKKDKKGSILLLVGPPGTGKTSLGKSIAQAMGREYIRLSLGGIRDESEIRGHRKIGRAHV